MLTQACGYSGPLINKREMNRMRTGIVTRRAMLALSIGGLAAGAFARSPAGAETLDRQDLYSAFEKHGFTGTFALFDVSANRLVLVNGKRANKQFVPASTFKIPNSLIALETGVVKDENEVIPYGGKPQPIKAWEKDMPMREAIVASNVPVYQELARRIGLERYREWLARLAYGNREIGTAVDRFWLDGPLRISAVEQVRFIANLAQKRLDASERAQSIVRDILRIETRDDAVLYGKTGWYVTPEEQVGWWTGWVERQDKVFTFALNIDMRRSEDAPKRLSIGKELLAELGVL